MNAMSEVAEIFDEESLKEEVEVEEQDDIEGEEIGLSVHALSDENPQKTIKIPGEAKGRALVILVDTGLENAREGVYLGPACDKIRRI